jgi:hypothetical protein
LKVKPKITEMGQIIQHQIKVDRIPDWMQQMVESKKVRKTEMLKRLDEWSKAKSQNQPTNA